MNKINPLLAAALKPFVPPYEEIVGRGVPKETPTPRALPPRPYDVTGEGFTAVDQTCVHCGKPSYRPGLAGKWCSARCQLAEDGY